MPAELELVVQPLSAMQVREQVNLIQEVMQSVMKDGTHFGKIPGAGDKPALFKAGAEKLASTFRLAIDPTVEELSYGNEFRVRIIARVTEMGTGRFLGAGVGEASSSESKYMWRAAVCPEEFDATPESLRREKWNKGSQNNGYKPWTQKQVRMNVADVANTILKMAKKRAMVDGILTVTGASDIFTQDIEELPKEYLDQKMTPAQVVPAQATQNPTQPAPKLQQDGDRGAGDTPRAMNAGQTIPAASGNRSKPAFASQEPGMYDEPDIRPRSQKGTPAPQQTQEQPPEPQGQVVDAEPSITEKQRKMLYAISKSAALSTEQVKAALAKAGLHCSSDMIPMSRFQDALNAVDPGYKFHAKK
jgi:hypothetical protein